MGSECTRLSLGHVWAFGEHASSVLGTDFGFCLLSLKNYTLVPPFTLKGILVW